jgi:hypothetical protein
MNFLTMCIYSNRKFVHACILLIGVSDCLDIDSDFADSDEI